MKARARALIAALAALALLAALPREARPPLAPMDEQHLLIFFDRLALVRGRGAAGGGDRSGWVRKWHGTVGVSLNGDVPADADAAVDDLLGRVSAWSGVEFRRTRWPLAYGQTVRIDYLSAAAMASRYPRRPPACMTATFGNGGRLHTARLEISLRFTDCLEHEFMHVLGFDNHWNGRIGGYRVSSVLAPRGAPVRQMSYSDWDEAAIRLLYDPRLPSGTPREVAISLARAILGAVREARR